MNNKILIAIAVLVIMLIGVVGWLLFTKPKPVQVSQTPPSLYVLNITEYNGSITASYSANNTTTQLTAINLATFALVSFNSPHDIMWVECPASYTPSNPASNNKINSDPVLKASNIELIAGQQNTLQLTCSK